MIADTGGATGGTSATTTGAGGSATSARRGCEHAPSAINGSNGVRRIERVLSYPRRRSCQIADVAINEEEHPSRRVTLSDADGDAPAHQPVADAIIDSAQVGRERPG